MTRFTLACALALAGACLAQEAAAQSAFQAAAAKRGEQIYARCAACHAMETDRVGPRHCGLFGRKAGAVPGFDYSAAMKSSRLVWDEKTLDRFLKSPMHTVPGTRMTYDGIADAGERHDLIAYLKQASGGPGCRR